MIRLVNNLADQCQNNYIEHLRDVSDEDSEVEKWNEDSFIGDDEVMEVVYCPLWDE